MSKELNTPWVYSLDTLTGNHDIFDSEGKEVAIFNHLQQDLAEHIVHCVNTMHQLNQMGIYDPVKFFSGKELTETEWRDSYIKIIEAKLAEKDKQIVEMTSVIRDRLKVIDSRFINHSEASHYINDIIRACNTLEGKPNK